LSFEDWSFENLVNFYREELTRIDQGKPTKLTEGNVKALRSHGVLRIEYEGGGGRKRVLTEWAREVLEALLEEEATE